MVEIYKSITGYEGLYEVSNLGNVRTCENKETYTTKHGARHWKQRILKQKVCQATRSRKRKDYRVNLWKDGKPKTFLVARLVAMAFCEGYKENMTVNHIDGNSLNNRSDNLEWITRKTNIKKGFEDGLYPTCKKITLINIETNDKKTFRSYSECGKYLGKSHNYISKCIKRGKTQLMNYRIERAG